MATARVTGYKNGTLELLGTAGISMLGTVQMNSNKITGLAAGTLSSSSTDAVNGSQLYGASQSVASALGGSSTVAENGTVSAPSYKVAGTTQISVGGALSALDAAAVQFNGTDNAVDVKGKKVLNVAAGDLNPLSTEAVNGSQLYTTNNDVTSLSTSTAAGLGSLSTGLSTVDGRVANVESSVTNLTTQLSTGEVGLVKQDAQNMITVASDKAGSVVDFRGTDGARTLSGVAAGTLADGSTEAVNGSQLYTTNNDVTSLSTSTAAGLSSLSTSTATGLSSLSTSTATGLNSLSTSTAAGLGSLSTGLSTVDGRVANVESSVTNLTTQLSTGEVGLVKQDAQNMITVASDKAGSVVDFRGTDGARTLSGVAAGTLADGSTEAVNGSQLYTTNNDVTSLSTSTAAGLSSLSTSTATGLSSLSTSTAAGLSSLSTSTAAGLSSLSTSTATGLNSLSTSTAAGLGSLSTGLSTVDGRVANVESSVTNLTTQLSTGEVGLVKQDAQNMITVASDKAGSVVDFRGTDGARTLSGVAAGTLADGSTEAVNGSQLYTTNNDVTSLSTSTAAGLSSLSTSTATGLSSLSTGLSTVDGRVANVESSVTNLTTQLSSGEVGLVKQDADTNAITVASDKAGTSVNISGTGGARTLGGVAAGALSSTSTEAVNGSQLFATDARVTTAEGAIAQNTTDITNVQEQINSGSIGLVQQDPDSRAITVGATTDGAIVRMAGKDSDGNAINRTVTGVAAGAVNASSVDAINGSQLYATASTAAAALGGDAKVNADGTISAPSYSVGGTTVHNVGDAVANLDGRVTQNTSDITTMQNQLTGVGTQLSGAVQYDRNNDGSVNLNSVKLGNGQSTGPVVLTNVANGTSQYDAVNFGQLSALQNQVSDLDTKVGNLLPGSPFVSATGLPDKSGVVNNAASSATGEGGTAVGVDAVASGNHATAIGAGAQATHSNSVALGTDSVTDRDNSVSVGSSTQQRQITNVAAGTADTDAVNVGQLNSSVSNAVSQGVQQANSYTDQRFNDANRAINDVAKNAYAGIAAAMAMPNMTPSGPGRTIVAAGAANYKGGNAVAAGATYRSRNGNWLVNGAVSVTNTGDAGVRAQVGYEF
ncbi:YadA family autotransporter adhesin [Paraburkholderia ginsengisoli]|uniref:YadA family autotransporter adhesin n=1 Tax=Paraburkholderia ginsengisoli TaxID=311231 RepID=UPI001E533B20|nr:YadA-like family protein [Paraburkholderia ginsengisoli]